MIGEEVVAVWGDAGDGAELFEVQKLVRCKECKKWGVDGHPSDVEDYHYCPRIELATLADDYCSYGEREGE